jgi:poly[(R)-3-hydroxyalkanoate] polymerase subunit PhaC
MTRHSTKPNNKRRLDRRLAPRPLPAHLASAMLLWQSSRAALRSLPSGWPSWSALASPPDARLAALAGEIGQLGAEAVAAALDREVARRAAGFAAGLEAYRRHPYRRPPLRAPVCWQEGNARLLDYGAAGAGPAVLLVPSLINRFTILDLLRECSFVGHLARAGLRPLVLDWGEPGERERSFALADYISGPLEAALAAAAALAGGPVGLLGYCMGGLLALALALRRPQLVASLALLATPWDFHAERPAQARFLATLIEWLPALLGPTEPVPVWVIQGLFMALDPFLAERKFVHFAWLDMAGEAARSFVALEDWINDGVPLAQRVALECARAWYRDNEPGRLCWEVAGMPVEPQELGVPALVVLPSRDKIVPPRSAAPLAALIPGAGVLRLPFGHIGMMASAGAPAAVWRPLADWLLGR